MPAAPANKRKQQQKRNTHESDEPFMASQGSDDTMITAAIVKQMQSNFDKKRKEKETKLLKSIQRDIDEALDTTREQFTKTVNDFQAEYEKMQLDLAAKEDDIRKTWVQIAELFERIQSNDKAELSRIEQGEAARSTTQEDGLLLLKTAMDMVDRQCRFLKNKAQNGHRQS